MYRGDRRLRRPAAPPSRPASAPGARTRRRGRGPRRRSRPGRGRRAWPRSRPGRRPAGPRPGVAPSVGKVATPTDALTAPSVASTATPRPLGDLQRAGRIGVRQQERELVAAVAEHEVGVAAGADELRRDAGAAARRRPGGRGALLTSRKSSRSSMIRLNGAPSRTIRSSHSSNVPWLSRPVRSSVRARISTAWNTSAFWSAIETWAANSWTSSNSSAENVLPDARAARSSARRSRRRGRAAARRSGCRRPGPSSRKWLTRGSCALVADVDRLVVLDDPGRDAGLARLPRLQVVRGVDAARRQRRRAGRSPDRRPRWRCCRRRSAAPSRSVMLSRTARASSVVRIDSVICEELALAAQLALEGRASARAAARSCRRWPSPGRRSSRRSRAAAGRRR